MSLVFFGKQSIKNRRVYRRKLGLAADKFGSWCGYEFSGGGVVKHLDIFNHRGYTPDVLKIPKLKSQITK